MDELEVWFESQQVDRISHCGEEVLRQQTVQRDSESIQILQCYCLCWLRSTGVLLLCFCHWVWPTETWCCCCKTIGFLCLLQPPVSDGGETKQTEVSSVVLGHFIFYLFFFPPLQMIRGLNYLFPVCVPTGGVVFVPEQHDLAEWSQRASCSTDTVQRTCYIVCVQVYTEYFLRSLRLQQRTE